MLVWSACVAEFWEERNGKFGGGRGDGDRVGLSMRNESAEIGSDVGGSNGGIGGGDRDHVRDRGHG